MSDGLNKLKHIGAQKIHEQTHIARHHIQALLDEKFDDVTKVQVIGFISILQREYGVDLSEYKGKVQEYFLQNTPEEDDCETRFFVAPTRKKKYTFVYVILAIVIFAVAVYYALDEIEKNAQKTNSHIIDNSAIQNAQKSMLMSEKPQDEEINETEDENSTTQIKDELDKEIVEPEVVEIEKSFKIIPSSELWIGYIDLSNYKKYQKLFTGELELDPNKDWLLTLGHGFVKIDINGEIKEFSDKSNIRLLYKDSNISKIDFTQFKELNRGQKW